MPCEGIGTPQKSASQRNTQNTDPQTGIKVPRGSKPDFATGWRTGGFYRVILAANLSKACVNSVEPVLTLGTDDIVMILSAKFVNGKEVALIRTVTQPGSEVKSGWFPLSNCHPDKLIGSWEPATKGELIGAIPLQAKICQNEDPIVFLWPPL